MIISSARVTEKPALITSSQKQMPSKEGDSVILTNGKEVKDDGFSEFLKKGFQHIKDYPKPRPETSNDTAAASPLQAGLGGGIANYMAAGHPINAVGGALGGYVGIKVGEKTESFGKMMGASFATGAVVNTALVTGMVLLESALTGAGVNIAPATMALIAGLGGLSGISGTLQGSCLGDVKDGSTMGMILGGIVSSMTGTPFMPLVASLAGAAGGLVEGKGAKLLASAGTGLVLGAASGVMGGPTGMVIGALIGAVTGTVSTFLGKPAMQVQRNIVDDIRKVTTKFLNKALDKLGIKTIGLKTATAIGAAGGSLTSLPMALMLSPIFGPVGVAIGMVAGGVVGGLQMYKMGKAKKKINEFSGTVKEFLPKIMPKEQLETLPPQAISGMATMFSQKYKTNEDFKNITPDQFAKDLQEFNKKAMEEQQKIADQVQAQIKEYSPVVTGFLSKMMPEEQFKSIPPQAITGISMFFLQKYSAEDFKKITPEQFIKDMDEFNKKAVEVQQQMAQAGQQV